MSVSVPLSAIRSRVVLLLKEPLVHFLCAAALISMAWHYLGKPEVRISPQLLNGMRKEYETAIGRKATPDEVNKLADEYLESEILYREALRTGLTQDNRVRGLLIQTMRTSLRPIVPEPTEAELVAFRNETPDIYRYPAKVSFEHVSFADAKDIPAGMMEKLRGGASPQGLGGPQVHLANPLAPTFRPQIEYLFGKDFTEALLKSKQGTWQGPFTSSRGVHFVRVVSLEPEHDMPMSELKPTLLAKVTGRKEAEIISRKVAEMRKSYDVIMPTKP